MTDFYFKELSPNDLNFDLAAIALTEILDPIYGLGSTARLLHKLIHANDRTCEVYYEEYKIKGLIIFKKNLTNEYEEFGVKNAYEKKTILPLIIEDKSESRLTSRKRVMLRLLNRTALNGINMNAECIFGTVSEDKRGTIKLFQSVGIEIVHTFKNKFKEGVDEHLIVHKNPSKLYEVTKI